jgi:hypothetical protein
MLADAEALTLFLARPTGRAAAGYAQRLLARFGSLPEALGAPRTDLVQVVPPKVALEIELLHDLQGRALIAPLRRRATAGLRCSRRAPARCRAGWPGGAVHGARRHRGAQRAAGGQSHGAEGHEQSEAHGRVPGDGDRAAAQGAAAAAA